MRMVRFHCLWLAVLLNSGLLVGQLEMKVEMPKRRLILGEPAYIKLTIKNIGQNPQRVLPIWAWNSGWIRGGHEFPCILERFDNGVWKRVETSAWARHGEGIYTSPYSSYTHKLCLEPGESFEVWWDIRWRYDLDEGRYRVSVKMRLGEEFGQGQELTCEPIEFEVKVPEGKDLEVWNKRHDYLREMWAQYKGKPTRVENLRYNLIYSWLTYYKADLDDTTYLSWSIYFRLQNIIYFNGDLFWIDPNLLNKVIEKYPNFPLIHRLEIVAKFLKFFPMYDKRVSYKEEDQILQQYPLRSKEWWERVRLLMAELVEWKDLEWAQVMIHYIVLNTYHLCLDIETIKKLDYKAPYYFLEKILDVQIDPRKGIIWWWELPKEKRPTHILRELKELQKD